MKNERLPNEKRMKDERSPNDSVSISWAQGPGPGLDLVIEFLPGNTEAREEAEWIINRLVENDIRTLPEDFLAYHQATLSPYRGMRGPVVETDEYPSVEACAKNILARILLGVSTVHG